ncbi:MAG: amidase [Acidimicrobiales bacterium]
MTSEIFEMSASELAKRIREREISPVEATQAYLERIDARNGRTNAYVTVLADQAMDAASAAEQKVASGAELGALHGVPVALKDSVPTAGVRTTSGSQVFKDSVPQVNGIEYERMIDTAGAILLGKTNLPEFAARGTTDNYLFGPTSTPFDLARNAGGSSGGSAAAVADRTAAVAQGSDGGGSIRIPASWCGVFGLLATFGRIPQDWRPNAYAPHTPHISSGPIARTVEDGALLLDVLAGPDPRCPICLPPPTERFTDAVGRSIEGLRIGYAKTIAGIPVDRRVATVVDGAVHSFEEAGASVETIEIDFGRPHEEVGDVWLRYVSVLYALDTVLMKRNGIDLLGEHRGDMAPELIAMMERGLGMSAVEYRADDVIRTEVLDHVESLFARFDVLVTPTLAALPVENTDDKNTLGPTSIEGMPVDPIIGWTLTYPFNFTGHPAASVPAGLVDGLPVGMQIVGHRFDEATVLAASAAFEKVSPWHQWYTDL